MKTVTSSTKFCATCANWGGKRELKQGGMAVEVKEGGERGKCYAGTPCSVTQGPTAVQTCSKYQKWCALK